MTSWLYAGLFLVLLFAWPVFLSETLDQRLLAVAFIVNAALAIFVIYQCSSMELSFFRGLDIISGRSMSGCANITIVYLFPLLLVVYLVALFHCLISVFRGRLYAQQRWIRVVMFFGRL